jgi:hypothetical protein
VDAHRVRRLAATLVTSQIRSGRSGSDPRSWFGRPVVLAVYDLLAFLVGAGGAWLFLPGLNLDPASLASLAGTAAPFLPLVGVGGVVLAGVMFELTTTAKFSGSDAANWLPITPTEYVAASASAIAYTYSPPVAVFLGALLPVALAGGVLPMYLLAAALSVLALVEGALLVEMVRATSQSAGSASTGRRGSLSTLLRGALLVVLLLAFDLAFNPVFLLDLLRAFPSFELLTAAIPFFWSTQAIGQWVAGDLLLAGGFAFGQLAFVVLLVYLAGALRVRYWVPSPNEAADAGAAPSVGHPLLGALGLSAAESAIASKDLRAYVRRREMLPTLVLPAVLILLLFAEGGSFSPLVAVLWGGWVAGFFALLLAARSVGQERRSLQWLYAYPITVRSVLKAKLASVLLPALLVAVLILAAVGAVSHVPPLVLAGVLPTMLVGTVVLGLWGLVFAARYSDFQDRPRPQFIRPGPMMGAMGSGMVVLFAILAPGALAVLSPSWSSPALLAWTAAAALALGTVAFHWARTGFEELFRELPF